MSDVYVRQGEIFALVCITTEPTDHENVNILSHLPSVMVGLVCFHEHIIKCGSDTVQDMIVYTCMNYDLSVNGVRNLLLSFTNNTFSTSIIFTII